MYNSSSTRLFIEISSLDIHSFCNQRLNKFKSLQHPLSSFAQLSSSFLLLASFSLIPHSRNLILLSCYYGNSSLLLVHLPIVIPVDFQISPFLYQWPSPKTIEHIYYRYSILILRFTYCSSECFKFN